MKCMNLFKRVSLGALILCFSLPLFATSTAAAIKKSAMESGSVHDGIKYIRTRIEDCATLADKRSLLCFLGSLQEMVGEYKEASASYVAAAGISAGDAANMPKVSNEDLVINAVRCCLNCGDYSTADSYLKSSVSKSSDEKVRAEVALYSVWSSLCRAATYAETGDAVKKLKVYAAEDSMKSVRAAILLTLWYVTNEKSYVESLRKDYPHSPEYAIATGNAQIMSAPFWYFVPRAIYSSPLQVEKPSVTSSAPKSSTQTSQSSQPAQTSKPSQTDSSSTPTVVETAPKAPSGSAPKLSRQQLGLFRSRSNAEALINSAKAKGFNAYYFTETRASGTTYYIVVVDENEDFTMGKKIRAAGFDCYPVE